MSHHPSARVLNEPPLPADTARSIRVGEGRIARFLCREIEERLRSRPGRPCRVAIDGYLGVDWLALRQWLQRAAADRGLKAAFLDIATCRKSASETSKLLQPYLSDDPVFGRICDLPLKAFFDPGLLEALRRRLRRYRRQSRGSSPSRPDAVICLGVGAALPALRACCDIAVYVDLTREEALRRTRRRKPGSTQTISEKRFYYVDAPVLERHRRRLLERIDCYLDANVPGKPKLLPGRALRQVVSSVAQHPFRLKPIYEPGPWGGQWLKKIRKLPKSMVNCAWSYEVIAPEMSLVVKVGRSFVELPFLAVLGMEPGRLMGERVLKQFRGEFPIRFDYLDTMEGGSLSIQVHPDTPYIHSQFGEPYHQGESYYIIAAKPGSRVYLGLKGQADEEKFRRLVRRSKRSGLPFDHQRYVNSLPSKVGDLFLIPPGTIHASGANQVVLEISATTYRYTFKLYDYLRPNLDGTMRPIHADHGFAQVRFSRRTDWVKQHLKQPPRLIRSGSGWSEYSLGDVRGLFHTAHRLEFSRQVPDAATDRFHILTIVEGEKAEIRSRKHPRRRRAFGFSETVIVPACFGEYTIRNLGRGKCKVVKSFVK